MRERWRSCELHSPSPLCPAVRSHSTEKTGRMARNGNERNKPISSWQKCLSTFLRNTVFNTSFDRVREKDYRSGQGVIVGLICSTSIQLGWWRHFNRIWKRHFPGNHSRASVVVGCCALATVAMLVLCLSCTHAAHCVRWNSITLNNLKSIEIELFSLRLIQSQRERTTIIRWSDTLARALRWWNVMYA